MELKPIHKYNGGIGATLCHKCNVIIDTGFTDDLYCEEHGGIPQRKYSLFKKGDRFYRYAKSVLWIEWNEDGTFKQHHDEISNGLSLVLDFAGGNFKWMTTQVISFEKKGNIINFKTKNSEYELKCKEKEE